PPYVGPPPQSKLESGAVVDDSLLPWVFSLPERRKGLVIHRRSNDDALMTIGRLQTKQRVETPTMSDEGSD
ncbi:hypothetical protein LINPERHAP1_LOCUS32696, partial [Linum perenne]